MRNFLLGVAALTAFGFLVLWNLPSLPRASGKMADTKMSIPSPVATPPPPVVEPELALALPPRADSNCCEAGSCSY